MRNNHNATAGQPIVPPVVQVSLQPVPTPNSASCFEDYMNLFRNICQPSDYVQHNIFALFVDSWDGVLGSYHLARGTQATVQLDICLLLNICLALRPNHVVIGHCLPQPAQYPSDRLLGELETIIQAVRMVNVRLEDYIIFNAFEAESMRYTTADSDAPRIFIEAELAGPPYMVA